MNIGVMFLAVFLAMLVWLFIARRLREKPWLVQGALDESRHAEVVFAPAAKLGLWVFMAVVTSLFSLLGTALYMRMHAHHGEAASDWVSPPLPFVLWLSTVLLILASVAFQWARVAARRGPLTGLKQGLLAAGVLSFAFLAVQLVAWQQLGAAGYFAAANPANAFFYLITALHGLHLLGGLWFWGRSAARVWQGVEAARVRVSVELCSVYWHFLLLVWLAMFALLLMS
jgi:cytochrome c oxidase subunit III